MAFSTLAEVKAVRAPMRSRRDVSSLGARGFDGISMVVKGIVRCCLSWFGLMPRFLLQALKGGDV